MTTALGLSVGVVRDKQVTDKDIASAYNRELRPKVSELIRRFNELLAGLTGGQVSLGVMLMAPVDAPADPPETGHRYLYVDAADGGLKTMDDAGVVTVIV